MIVEVDEETHGTNAERRRDHRRTMALEENGYAVIRVWNSEVLRGLDGVLRLIDETCEERLSGPLLAPAPWEENR